MQGRHLRAGMTIDGRLVKKAVTGTATFKVAKSTYLAPARLVTLAGESRPVAFELDRPVMRKVTGYAESFPAGGVASANVKTPPQIRASDKKWRGESVRGMRTRDHDMIANTNMFDTGRVNGSTGTFPGAGPVALTGPSFTG